ncbi:hypothetical protein QL285_031400 [Trifolium repens]|nr:hypothetical protein QL285_031400 [Trifolium repens]
MIRLEWMEVWRLKKMHILSRFNLKVKKMYVREEKLMYVQIVHYDDQCWIPNSFPSLTLIPKLFPSFQSLIPRSPTKLSHFLETDESSLSFSLFLSQGLLGIYSMLS